MIVAVLYTKSFSSPDITDYKALQKKIFKSTNQRVYTDTECFSFCLMLAFKQKENHLQTSLRIKLRSLTKIYVSSDHLNWQEKKQTFILHTTKSLRIHYNT